MPTAADHLRAYVARLAAGTDDLSATPDPDLARVRRAAAGESLPRLRDRLLLERAAWLARETERPLRDIAVDCDFTGYDVFVRAFRRELGARPSDWRADPTSWAIDAPGDVHLQPPDGIRLPARSRCDPLDLVVAMVEQHVREVAALVAAADGLPGLRPPSAATALAEVVGRLERLAGLVHGTTYDPGTLRERMDAVGPDVVSAVAVLGAGGRFDEAVVDVFAPAPRVVTLGEMVTRAVTDADDLLRTARADVMGITGANRDSS